MTQNMSISRRALLRHAPAAGVATLASSAALAQPVASRQVGPPSGDFVIRGAQVLSMDPKIGDFVTGDVFVSDGRITAVAASVNAPGVTEIQAAGMICMPGMVDTHQHMWTTPFRGLVNEEASTSYGAAKPPLGKVSTPQDTYAAHMLAMTSSLYAGTTTSNNLNHNCRGPDHSDAVLKAMVDSGQRGRFSYGSYDGLSKDKLMDFDDISRVQKLVKNGIGGGLVTFGLFPRGPNKEAPSVFTDEVIKARTMGLPISLDGPGENAVQLLADNKMLAKSVLVHCIRVTETERKLMAQHGAAYSAATWSEMSAVLGMPVFLDMDKDGVLVSLSIDTQASPSEANMFNLARLTSVLAHILQKDQFAFTHKKALEYATINGAKALGLDDKIGSLTPGKRADILLVRTDTLNMNPAPGLNPYRLLLSAQAEDVDTVIVDGKVVKFKGALTHIDAKKVIADAAASLTAMRERAHWPA
ncbi:MAG: amidohydrolase family protein [Hyphomonadaceae bacterium]|nr:amidohydrolase family protein [Hyphomonadaceae bacterium]